MEDLKYLFQEFRDSEFDKKHKEKRMSISSEEDIRYVVMKKAYKDMMIRTIKKENANAAIDIKKRDEVLKWLSHEFLKFFKDEGNIYDENFSKWHEKICEEFLNKFNGDVLKDNYKPIQFGKAQKIVNMTFKYLRCFDDADDYSAFFVHCQMPMDSFMIEEWYNKNNVGNGEKISCAWSNFRKDCYYDIQSQIKVYCEKSHQTPLEVDFIEWKKIKEKKKKEKASKCC